MSEASVVGVGTCRELLTRRGVVALIRILPQQRGDAVVLLVELQSIRRVDVGDLRLLARLSILDGEDVVSLIIEVGHDGLASELTRQPIEVLLVHTLRGIGAGLQVEHLRQVFLSSYLRAEHTHDDTRLTALQIERIGRDRANEGELIVALEALPFASPVGLIRIREEVQR